MWENNFIARQRKSRDLHKINFLRDHIDDSPSRSAAVSTESFGEALQGTSYNVRVSYSFVVSGFGAELALSMPVVWNNPGRSIQVCLSTQKVSTKN
jgi:hypothetical protein